MNKKEFNTLSEEVLLIYSIFKEMNFKRYQEFDYKKNGFSKRIKFTMRNKFSQEIFLTEEQYKQWRKLLNRLVKNENR